MKFLRFLFLAVGSVTAALDGREILHEQATKEQQPFANGIADCAVIQAAILPDGTTPDLRGNLMFLGPIHCQVPTGWTVQADTVVESQTAIDTMNLVLIVRPGIHLILRAPSVSLKRGEALKEIYNAEAGGVRGLNTAPGVRRWIDGERTPPDGPGGRSNVLEPAASFRGRRNHRRQVNEHRLMVLEARQMFSNQPPHFGDVEIIVEDPTDAVDDNINCATSNNDHNNDDDDDDDGSNTSNNGSSAVTADAVAISGCPQGTTTPSDGEKEPVRTGVSTSPTLLPCAGPTTSDDDSHTPHAGSGNQSPPAPSPNAGTLRGEEEFVPLRGARTRVRPMRSVDSGNCSTPASTPNLGTCERDCECEGRMAFLNACTHAMTQPD